MAKFVFFGDSITDACRNKELDFHLTSYGYGYVRSIYPKLLNEDVKHVVYNRGISGDRVVDLYARIKKDVWNLEPDVLTIYIGVNDVWHELAEKNGVDIVRFENIYQTMIKETLERLPNVKIILIEPYVLHGFATDEMFDKFLQVKEYAKVVDKLAKQFNLPIVKIQDVLDKQAKINGSELYSDDGVHPSIIGGDVIADEWFKVYSKNIK